MKQQKRKFLILALAAATLLTACGQGSGAKQEAKLSIVCTTYPVYKKILNTRKKKYAHKIMELSDRITKG